MNRLLKTAFLMSLLLLTTGCSLSPSHFREYVPSTAAEQSTSVREASSLEKKEIFVYVCGCVKHPDVYRLPAEARATDAVKAAGGFTKEADREAWNLALPLEDGMQIDIPSVQEASAANQAAGQTNTQEGRININTASEEELQTLPGIGQSRAKEIITYRESQGSFSSIEDIRNVSGIGDGIFTKIKDHITVS